MRLCYVTFGALVCLFLQTAQAEIPTRQFKNRTDSLTIEVLSDQSIHFDYSPIATSPSVTNGSRLAITPFVNQTEFAGPSTYTVSQEVSSDRIETRSARIEVDQVSLCMNLTDLVRGEFLTRICPNSPSAIPASADAGRGLTIEKNKIQNIYGLGEQFQSLGETNHDWSGRIRTPGCKFGNGMERFGGGGLGNAQIPILYALGADSLNFALYLDTVYPLQWDFTSPLWKVSQTQKGADSNSLRGYFFFGKDLPALRTQFMDLVGHPLVPPKKALGLWVSEFGYRNWKEIKKKLKGLRHDHFPIDGFVSDVYWFGGYIDDSPMSPMGLLDWDTQNFPNAAKVVDDLDKKDGVGLMLIEESFISKGLDNYKSLADRGYFVDSCTGCAPTVYHAWWGQGAMIDWTNPSAGAAWHNEHRKKLTDIGITFHWTDLGEPENWINENIFMGGKTEADAHNTYNFLWHKSIHDGYLSNHESKRHFILSRSGEAGMQRFGSAMWSGDIGSNMPSLASHLNVQMNMSLSGMDYFGADVGGFNRLALEGDMGEVYSRWLAHATLFDVPIRPHTDNGIKKNETAPNRIGSVESNLFNLRQRYELAPYYYSLSYLAYQSASPLIPPLVYYYQNDPNVRTIADEKMIGRDLLAGTAAKLGENNRGIYLPAGEWFDYHSLKHYVSKGEWFANFQMENNGVFTLPLFARAGAILPKALVDDRTMNILGKRTDGSHIQDLMIQVFAGEASSFSLFEDDGVTESYKGGAFSRTEISQNTDPHHAVVTIGPSIGAYDGSPTRRQNQVELVLTRGAVSSVHLNGSLLTHRSEKDLARAKDGWTVTANGVVRAKSGEKDVSQVKTFEFEF